MSPLVGIWGEVPGASWGRDVFRGRGPGEAMTPRGAMLPNRRLSGFLTEKRLCWDCSLYQKCSVDLKYAINALSAGAPLRTPLELTTLPRTLSRLGRGTPLPILTSRRLWRLDSRAFGAQLLCPQCKILATPLSWGIIQDFFIVQKYALLDKNAFRRVIIESWCLSGYVDQNAGVTRSMWACWQVCQWRVYKFRAARVLCGEPDQGLGHNSWPVTYRSTDPWPAWPWPILTTAWLFFLYCLSG